MKTCDHCCTKIDDLSVKFGGATIVLFVSGCYGISALLGRYLKK
ncbi:MAG: hypothetical protein ABSE81_04460 [Candidatus Omnitrophota bacterium]|jgi:hypothetical protein